MYESTKMKCNTCRMCTDVGLGDNEVHNHYVSFSNI